LVKEQNPKFNSESVVRHRHCLYNHCPKSSIVFNRSAGAVIKNSSELEQIVEETDVDVATKSGWVHTESSEVRYTEPRSEKSVISQTVSGTDQVMNCGDTGTDRVFELDGDTISALKRSAHLIFEKYVDNRAALEINIGHGLRNQHYRLHRHHFASLSTMQWISLYDDILAVLQEYIVQSYLAMIRQLRVAEKNVVDSLMKEVGV